MDFFWRDIFASEYKINLLFEYNISHDPKSVELNQIGQVVPRHQTGRMIAAWDVEQAQTPAEAWLISLFFFFF